MANTKLHLYTVYNHAIDYSKVFSNTFDKLPKQYYGAVDLGYYLPLDDEIDIQLGSELLRTTTNKNLYNHEQDYISLSANTTFIKINGGIKVRANAIAGGNNNYVRFRVLGLPVGLNVTFSAKFTFNIGADDSSNNIQVRNCLNVSPYTETGTLYYLQNTGSLTIPVTDGGMNFYFVARSTLGTQDIVDIDFTDIQLEVSDTKTAYEPFHTADTNVFNNINYIVAENDDETRYYFVKDKKKRVAHNTRVYSLKSDEWFNKQLYLGIDCIQYGGHASDKFNLWERKEYIEKPQYPGFTTALSGSVTGGDAASAGIIIVFYKTPTSVLSVGKMFTSNALIYDYCSKLFNTTKLRTSAGVDEVDVTAIRAYIIPSAFLSNFPTAKVTDIYDTTASPQAWIDNYCRIIIIGESYSSGISIDLDHSELYPYQSKTVTQLITASMPYKITVGVLGHTYEIDAPDFSDTVFNAYIHSRVVIGTTDLSVAIKSEFTDSKWVEISSAFEEVVTYSAYYDFVNQNRNSIATQRNLNYVSMGIGAVGALSTGNVTGLVNAIGSYASTQSSIADLKHKNCITVGNQAGFMNIVYSAARGVINIIAEKETCYNSEQVYKTILKFGYNFDRVSTNTSDLISLRHYTYETQAKTTYIDTELVEPITSVYNSFRYMVADLVHATSNAIIPEDVKTAFKKGCYVFNTPVLS